MKAARFYAKEDLRVEEVPEPSPGAGEVKLRNVYVGICGSDLHYFFYPESLPFDVNEPHSLTGAKLPQILGHEFAGTVVEVGEGVSGVKVGDRAAVYPMISCGTCVACRRGRPYACRQLAALGSSASSGGLAEFSTFDASQLHLLPENVDLRMGALVEPMAVGWHAVERSGVQSGGSALIAGAGPIGIGAWFALKSRGVERVVVSEPNAERRATIAALGATVVDPVNEDLAAAVAELTGADGVDVAIDAAGAGPVISSGLASLTAGGRLVVVALHEHPVDFLPTQLMMAETEIIGAVGYLPEEFDAVIQAMGRGVYDTTGWVQETTLDQVVDAIRALRSGAGTKILIRTS